MQLVSMTLCVIDTKTGLYWGIENHKYALTFEKEPVASKILPIILFQNIIRFHTKISILFFKVLMRNVSKEKGSCSSNG